MHIHLISQYLNLSGWGEDRFYLLGREWVSRGHQVTVFTIARGLGLDLKGKKIGLLQQEGMTVVAFNLPYERQMSSVEKFVNYLRFAGMIGRQGRLLPRPDLVVLATPPLTAALPALKLCRIYDVPLVVEVRELWPDAPLHRGSFRGRLPAYFARRLEHKLYGKASRIVATGQGIADSLKVNGAGNQKVEIVPSGIDGYSLIDRYDRVFRGLPLKGQLCFYTNK